jgi:hypothetical protein
MDDCVLMGVGYAITHVGEQLGTLGER